MALEGIGASAEPTLSFPMHVSSLDGLAVVLWKEGTNRPPELLFLSCSAPHPRLELGSVARICAHREEK